MGAVTTKTNIEQLAETVRRLEVEVREAQLAAADAEWHVRQLPPFGGEGDIAHIRRRTTAVRRDELKAELEAARVRWLELARPGLIAQRDEGLEDARIAAKDREAAVGALFDALDGLLRANAAWSTTEVAVRDALERMGAACAALGEVPAGTPLRGEHPLVFLRPPDLPALGLLFGAGGIHPPPAEAFEAARAGLARARKAQER